MRNGKLIEHEGVQNVHCLGYSHHEAEGQRGNGTDVFHQIYHFTDGIFADTHNVAHEIYFVEVIHDGIKETEYFRARCGKQVNPANFGPPYMWRHITRQTVTCVACVAAPDQ